MADDDATLLDVLREQLGIRSAKDGCSPQGQCGCCTVWVDGAPRVACVTPVRRLAGREVTTLDGLPEGTRQLWSEALVATGGSQCGFCTPGILMRLAALGPPGSAVPTAKIDQALVAHLCRCTGWQTIEEAAARIFSPPDADPASPEPRRSDRAEHRAAIEGGVPQRVGAAVVLGEAGFADDTSPSGALVAVPDGQGDYVVAESLGEARNRAGKVQGRSTSLPLDHPVELPPGEWDLTLRTTWVEPAYVEPDASWCRPGEAPAGPYGNGGAFGGKLHSPVAADARRLADRYGRPVRVLWSREDVVRLGPKRPPVAGGIGRTGAGTLRVGIPVAGVDEAQWAEVVSRAARVAPSVELEVVPLAGPPVGLDARGAVWVEAAVLAAAVGSLDRHGPGSHRDIPVEVVAPGGGRAVARCGPDDSIHVVVAAGQVLDRVVLRSYCIGAAHQALGWVRSEGIAVDADGAIRDLTMRSFGILQARAMPPVEVVVDPAADGPPVNGSDAVFAAVAAARWLADGLGGTWPVDRVGSGRR